MQYKLTRIDPDAPLMIVVSRLTGQKGLDMLLPNLDGIVQRAGQEPNLSDCTNSAASCPHRPGRSVTTVTCPAGAARRVRGRCCARC